MKLRTLFMMALLFAGVTFFAGCGDKEAPAAAATTTAAAESDEDQAKAACEKLISSKKDEMEKEGGITNLEFAKVKKVNDTYIMILYSAKLKEKGDKPVAFHMKKKDGKWEFVEFEDNWEPKDY